MLDVHDRSRRELTLALTVAVCLVLLRCAAPTLFEGFFFDSDQAIVGLMARHLAAGRDFPLYYYGQSYLLGVQAWIIAPFFLLFRSSVTVMRIPLVLLNVLAAIWLVVTLTRRLGLRPWIALIAALPFVAAAPPAATHLLEVGGASIEPIVYVLVLWALRGRPFAFGALLAIGFQQREWTIFAVPALVLAEAATGELWSRRQFRRAGWFVVGFAAVWLVLDDLKMHLTSATAALQMAHLGGSLCLDSTTPRRIALLFTDVIPPLFGGARLPPFSLGMNTTVSTGHPIVGWIAAVTLVLIIVRVAWTSRVSRDLAFPLYLGCVGVFALCAYPASCTIKPGGMPLLRYVIFGLLLPIGAAAAFFRCERARVLRTVVAAVFVIWAAASVFDTGRVLAAAIHTEPPDEHRVLADYLVEHGIHYARAGYWDAYIVDFLARERVIVASREMSRVEDYQREVDAHPDVAVNIVRLPCDGFAKVASWCLQR